MFGEKIVRWKDIIQSFVEMKCLEVIGLKYLLVSCQLTEGG